MLSKTFVFNRIQKTVTKIEEDLNKYLEEVEFKYATQNESTAKGKFIVTIFGNKKKGTIRAKVFKDQYVDKIDIEVNKFLAKHGMKFATQTFVGSSVYTIIFYDTKSEDSKPTGDSKTTTAPATTTTTTQDANTNGTNQN